MVLEVDWSGLSGFEYWNALEQAGRLCMETSRVQKRCFHSVEAAVRLPTLSILQGRAPLLARQV